MWTVAFSTLNKNRLTKVAIWKTRLFQLTFIIYLGALKLENPAAAFLYMYFSGMIKKLQRDPSEYKYILCDIFD